MNMLILGLIVGFMFGVIVGIFIICLVQSGKV